MSLIGLARIVQQLFRIYEFFILVWCILSWAPARPGGFIDDLRGALGMLVMPYLRFFQRLIPPIGGFLDISPIIAVFALGLIERLVLGILI